MKPCNIPLHLMLVLVHATVIFPSTPPHINPPTVNQGQGQIKNTKPIYQVQAQEIVTKVMDQNGMDLTGIEKMFVVGAKGVSKEKILKEMDDFFYQRTHEGVTYIPNELTTIMAEYYDTRPALYVLRSNGEDNNGVITIIDIESYKIIADIEVGKKPAPAVLVGTNLYVLNKRSNSVSVIDTQRHKKITDIKVGVNPTKAILVGTNLYVVNYGSATVSIIDTQTQSKVGDDIEVGKKPADAILVGTNLYVVNQYSSTVSIIDTQCHCKVGKDIFVGQGFLTNPVLLGKNLYVVYQHDDDNTDIAGAGVSVINTESHSKVVYDINIGSFPEKATLIEEKKLAVACRYGLYVINLDKLETSLPEEATSNRSGDINTPIKDKSSSSNIK